VNISVWLPIAVLCVIVVWVLRLRRES